MYIIYTLYICSIIIKTIEVMTTYKTKMQTLIEKREDIAYRLRYASRQGWATEKLEKDFEDIKNDIKNQAHTNNFEAEYYAY